MKIFRYSRGKGGHSLQPPARPHDHVKDDNDDGNGDININDEITRQRQTISGMCDGSPGGVR